MYREYNREFLLPQGTNPELIKYILVWTLEIRMKSIFTTLLAVWKEHGQHAAFKGQMMVKMHKNLSLVDTVHEGYLA